MFSIYSFALYSTFSSNFLAIFKNFFPALVLSTMAHSLISRLKI